MVGETRRFFRIWPYTEANELAVEEIPAVDREGYSSVWYRDGCIDRAEYIRSGEVQGVSYQINSEVAPDLRDRHRALYGNTPFRAESAEKLIDGLLMQETHRYDEAGTLVEIIQDWSSPDDGRRLRSVWFTPDRKPNGSREEEYAADGQRLRTIERDSKGRVVAVFDADE